MMNVEYRCKIFDPGQSAVAELVHTIEVTMSGQTSVPEIDAQVRISDENHNVRAKVDDVLWDFTRGEPGVAHVTVFLADTATDGGPYYPVHHLIDAVGSFGDDDLIAIKPFTGGVVGRVLAVPVSDSEAE